MLTYHNTLKDITVRIDRDGSFVIIGDDTKVTDKEIMAMHAGRTPKGWRRTQGW